MMLQRICHILGEADLDGSERLPSSQSVVSQSEREEKKRGYKKVVWRATETGFLVDSPEATQS